MRYSAAPSRGYRRSSPNPSSTTWGSWPTEKRRAFVRIGNGIIVFPGGVGTPKRSVSVGILLPKKMRTAVSLILDGPAARHGFRANRHVSATHPRRGGDIALRNHHRRSGRCRQTHGCRLQSPREPHRAQGFVVINGAECRSSSAPSHPPPAEFGTRLNHAAKPPRTCRDLRPRFFRHVPPPTVKGRRPAASKRMARSRSMAIPA